MYFEFIRIDVKDQKKSCLVAVLIFFLVACCQTTLTHARIEPSPGVLVLAATERRRLKRLD